MEAIDQYQEINERKVIEKEFSMLFNKHKGLIFYVFKRYGFEFCKADEKDCFQLISIEVWKRYLTHRDEMRFRFVSWLFTIAKHRGIDYCKRLRVQNKYYRCMEYLDILLPTVEYDEYMLDTLKNAIDSLPREDQEVIKIALKSEDLEADSLKMGKSKSWLETRRWVITKKLKDIAPKFFPGFTPRDPVDRPGAINNYRSKEIDQYEVNGTLVKRWKSLGDIERAGFSKSTVSKIINTKGRNICGGYKWTFAGEVCPEGDTRISTKIVEQFDMRGNLVKRWNSINEAAAAGFSESSLRRIFKGSISNIYQGYKWVMTEIPVSAFETSNASSN